MTSWSAKKTVMMLLFGILITLAIEFLMHSMVTAVPFGNSQSISLRDWNYTSAQQVSDIEGDGLAWKKARRLRLFFFDTKTHYVRLNRMVDHLQAGETLKITAGYAPIQVLIDGEEVYNSGFGSLYYAKQKTNLIPINQDYSNCEIDVYAVATQTALPFNLQRIAPDSDVFSDNFFSLAIRLMGLMLVCLGLVMLLLLACARLARASSNILFFLAMQSVVIGLLICSETVSHGADLLYPLSTFRVQPVLLMLVLFGTLCLTNAACKKRFAWQKALCWVLGAYILLFALVRSDALTQRLLCAMPVLLITVFVTCMINIARPSKRQPFLFAVLLTAFVFSSFYQFVQWYNPLVISSFLSALLFCPLLLGLKAKQLMDQKRLAHQQQKKRLLQLERYFAWIERIDALTVGLLAVRTPSEFCEKLADAVREIEKEDLQKNARAKTALEGNLTVSLATKTEGEFKLVFPKKMDDTTRFSDIEKQMLERQQGNVMFCSRGIYFGLQKNNEMRVICHLQGLKNGLSEEVHAAFRTAYHNIAAALEVIDLKNEKEDLQHKVFLNLATITDAKSLEASQHNKRVEYYTKEICLAYGLSEEESVLVSRAAAMHDVGKLVVPEEILRKQGGFTSQEFAIVKNHIIWGHNILSSVEGKLMQAAAIIAQQHHERWGGSGYLGLAGEEIHVYARIAAIADVFDALTSPRPYKQIWSPEDARRYINKQANILFEEKAVLAFNTCFHKIIHIKEKYS